MVAGGAGNPKLIVKILNSRQWYGIALVFILLTLIVSITSFMIGFHNVDIGFNMVSLQLQTGIEFFDERFDGEIVTGGTAYLTGLRLLMPNFLIAMVMAVVLGFAIGVKRV